MMYIIVLTLQGDESEDLVKCNSKLAYDETSL